MAYTYVSGVNIGTAGLTLTASVVDTAGSAIGSQPAYTVVDLGSGWYGYQTAAMPDGHTGWVKLLNGAVIEGVLPVAPREHENADVLTSTRSSHTAGDVQTGLATSAAQGTAQTDLTTLTGRLTAPRATSLDNLNATVSSRSSHTAADVWAVAGRTLTSFGTLVTDVAAAVWGAATRTLTAFGFSVTVGSNSDKTGYALTTGERTAILAAFQADVEWQTLLANANGDWVLTPPVAFPGTGTLVLKDKAGAVTLATFTLTFNADKVVTERASS